MFSWHSAPAERKAVNCQNTVLDRGLEHIRTVGLSAIDVVTNKWQFYINISWESTQFDYLIILFYLSVVYNRQNEKFTPIKRKVFISI